MSLPDLTRGDANRISKVEVVVPPLGNVLIVKFPECGRSPRYGMNAVGDRPNWIAWKHAARHLGMLHGHAVDVAGTMQSQGGHVQ